MNNLVQMPDAAPIDREAEQQEIESRKREATFHWRQVTQAAVLASRNSLRVGFHALALKDKGAWGLCGFRDEEEAREAANVSNATWYAKISQAEHFRGVPEDIFCAMKDANCKAACDLPLSVRTSPEWLEWAAKDSIKAFAKRVSEEMEGKARPSGTVEPNVPFKASMPVSQRRAVTQGIKDYAEKVGIDPTDTGTILETMVAEQRGGVSLIQAITNGVQHIKDIKALVASGISADEALEKAQAILDDMILEFAAALQNASQAEEAA
jgi:hypothetical protein